MLIHSFGNIYNIFPLITNKHLWFWYGLLRVLDTCTHVQSYPIRVWFRHDFRLSQRARRSDHVVVVQACVTRIGQGNVEFGAAGDGYDLPAFSHTLTRPLTRPLKHPYSPSHTPSHTPLLAHYLAPLLSPPITPIHTPLLTPPVTIFHTHPLLHTLSYTPLTHTLIPPPIHTSTLSHTHFHPLSHNRGRHIGPRAR